MIHVQMALVSCSTNTETADLKDEDESVLIDKWLFDMVYSPASCLLHTMKGFLSAYENGPTEIRLVSFIVILIWLFIFNYNLT